MLKSYLKCKRCGVKATFFLGFERWGTIHYKTEAQLHCRGHKWTNQDPKKAAKEEYDPYWDIGD